MRKPWIGGNWKCNGTIEQINILCNEFKILNKVNSVDICIFPTALHYSLTKELLPANFQVGLQNTSAFGNGAYTGEISATIAADINCKWILCGHSERRQIFKETNEIIAEKVKQAMKANLNVVLCVGETIEERDSMKTFDVCASQLKSNLSVIEQWNNIVIAYEPVWAIGTGKVATKEQAQEVHKYIRTFIKENVSNEVSNSVRIVYGGSVNAQNCEELATQPDIDGFLIGGASLKKDFIQIVQCKQ